VRLMLGPVCWRRRHAALILTICALLSTQCASPSTCSVRGSCGCKVVLAGSRRSATALRLFCVTLRSVKWLWL